MVSDALNEQEPEVACARDLRVHYEPTAPLVSGEAAAFCVALNVAPLRALPDVPLGLGLPLLPSVSDLASSFDERHMSRNSETDAKRATPKRKRREASSHGATRARDREVSSIDQRRVAALQSILGVDVVQRIAIVRAGVPASIIELLSDMLLLPKQQLIEGLGLARATVNRQLKTDARLTAPASERVVGLARIMSNVQHSLAGSDAEAAGFLVGPWLGTWLVTPNPALGGLQPLSLFDTADGRTLVADLLGSMEAGTYW